MAEPPLLQLPDVDPALLAVVIRRMLTEDRAGAEARGFEPLLEIAYLVASADSLDADEREGLVRTFEQLTSTDRAALEQHLHDFDDAIAASNRADRLRQAATDLHPDDRGGAVAFAAAIAMSDGWLGDSELGVLVELGGHLEINAELAREIVESVIARVETRLR